MKILLLEAYYGGSHKLWADQLQEYSTHDIELLTLPARHWKWRMEGASFEFAKLLQNQKIKPDLIIATSMMDLSYLNSNLPKGWQSIPSIYYMHENQLSYPLSKRDNDKEKGRDFHYGMIQFKSMLTATKTCFNSQYHKKIFFEALVDVLNVLPDFVPKDQMIKLQEQSLVLPLGIRDTRKERKTSAVPTILWNHRWEYDKNPEAFFNVLFKLQEKHQFKLTVMGAQARSYPAIFDQAKDRLADNIEHWGYVENSEEYLNLLNKADILPVTSNQDFFGISIMEAVLAGVTPILPKRLVYPEHFDIDEHKKLFYNTDEEMYELLVHQILHPIEESQKNNLINKAKEYLWSKQIIIYDQIFESIKH